LGAVVLSLNSSAAFMTMKAGLALTTAGFRGSRAPNANFRF
jgi:hypothetical protein